MNLTNSSISIQQLKTVNNSLNRDIWRIVDEYKLTMDRCPEIKIVYVKSKQLATLYVCDVRENNTPGPLKVFCSR